MLPLVTLEGRVVNDPELRFAPSGVAVGDFRMVCSSRKKNEAGEWVDDKTLWMPVTTFKKLAENCAESIRKGDLVTVVGRIETREWEDKEGQKKSRVQCVADSVAVSLQFRTVEHAARAERSSTPVADDPWATPGTAADEPPF